MGGEDADDDDKEAEVETEEGDENQSRSTASTCVREDTARNQRTHSHNL
jgi:hypothetical protein